jgi:hypothetical protein
MTTVDHQNIILKNNFDGYLCMLQPYMKMLLETAG